VETVTLNHLKQGLFPAANLDQKFSSVLHERRTLPALSIRVFPLEHLTLAENWQVRLPEAINCLEQ
jgi:hypothetical protein